jgi:hypothetical protein
VETQPSQQSLIGRSIGEACLQRRVSVYLPYSLAAIRTLEATELGSLNLLGMKTTEDISLNTILDGLAPTLR